jgi:hypothetical protein
VPSNHHSHHEIDFTNSKSPTWRNRKGSMKPSLTGNSTTTDPATPESRSVEAARPAAGGFTLKTRTNVDVNQDGNHE